MRTGIVTVNNSYNYGSYLQAKNLLDVTKKYTDAVLVDTKSRNMWKDFLKKTKRRLKSKDSLNDRLKGISFEFKEARELERCWKSLPVIDKSVKCDGYILGSDEIWNISRSVCRYGIFYGNGLDGKVISYAPSVNDARRSDFDKYSETTGNFEKIDHISVRDSYSKEIVDDITGIDSQIVLDPTLLKKPEKSGFNIGKPYVALYLFGWRISDEDKKGIREFADKNGFLLVSAGQYLSWCDMCVNSKNGYPFYVFENAQFVITNTFHGSAYSVNYEKQMCALVNNRSKVYSFLSMLGIEDRCVDNVKDIDILFKKKIDYAEINKTLEMKKKVSENFLKENLS